MEFTWLESFLYGFVTGLANILPVSSQAHRVLMLKIFGVPNEPILMKLLVHISIFAALYFSSQSQITRIVRAKSMARIPKKKRRRPLDTKSLMDYRLLLTMVFPVIVSFFLYKKVSILNNNILILAGLLFVNGFILYIPQFLPSSNKDARTLSRVEGLLMGLGGALGIVPGISGIGAALSIGSMCGVERAYALTMTLLMTIFSTLGLIIFDIMEIAATGIVGISLLSMVSYVFAAIMAFLGVCAAVRIMRKLAGDSGFSVFAYYCWGQALFSFILNLMS